MRSVKTRRITAIIMALCLAIAMLPSFASAETGIVKTCDENEYIPVYLNGEEIYFQDVNPVIINGRTMVPMRAIFEAFGMEVQWDASDRSIYSEKDYGYFFKGIWMQINNRTMYINEETKTMDVPPMIYYNRTLVPLRALSEALDVGVYWDSQERAVYLTTNEDYSLG